MASNLFRNGDDLATLPVDDVQLSYKEKNMLDALYPPETVKSIETYIQQGPRKIWTHFREIILATLLFFILSLPVVDTLLSKFVAFDNIYYRLACKAILFALLFFMLANFSLSRS